MAKTRKASSASSSSFRRRRLAPFRIPAVSCSRTLRSRPRELRPQNRLKPRYRTCVSACFALLPLVERRVSVVGANLASEPTTHYADFAGPLTGATGLEPATSGVTGRLGCGDAGRRATLNDFTCSISFEPAPALSSGLRRPPVRCLGHEWATNSCLRRQRSAEPPRSSGCAARAEAFAGNRRSEAHRQRASRAPPPS
jgi:hypothetical protein